LGIVNSAPAGDFKATITDGLGREVCSFRLVKNDRFIVSSDGNEVACRRLSREEQYWTRETIIEVFREMNAKN